jgi:hypothetical protein
LETQNRPSGCLLLADLDAQQKVRLTLTSPDD